jgi:hypothetical protein
MESVINPTFVIVLVASWVDLFFDGHLQLELQLREKCSEIRANPKFILSHKDASGVATKR